MASKLHFESFNLVEQYVHFHQRGTMDFTGLHPFFQFINGKT